MGRLNYKDANALVQAQMKTIKDNLVRVLETMMTCLNFWYQTLHTMFMVESLKRIQSFLSGEIPIQFNALHRKQLVANNICWLEKSYNIKNKDEVL